ncbi:hypothetical protein ANO14919_092680 [Xylariales sp. No.14919]|nr:hypothetical protein ANO14919_092680 [Xylariales sp. No.14919]
MTIGSSLTCVSVDCPRIFLFQPPSLAGNAVLLAFFTILIPIALALGVKYKSPGFTTFIATGLALEAVGYVGRLLLRNNQNNPTYFAIFLTGTTLGPTCICGAMFSVVPRIIAIYGEEYRSWRPFWYLLLLSALTIASLALELVGSVVSTTQEAPTVVEAGIRLLVVGLAIQLVALSIFALHATLFTITLRTRQHNLDPKFAPVYTSTLFKISLAAFIVATALILLRTIFRTIQIVEGFQSSIAQAETHFLLLDGVTMLITSILFLACFPARALGEYWPDTSVRRPSPKPLQLTHQTPGQPLVTRPSPTYSATSMKSPMSTHSPRKAGYWASPSLVENDKLW